MVEVTYYKAEHKVTATGHCNSAPKGSDLVCAAVSMLIHTLAADVEQLAKVDHRHIRRPHIDIDDGKANVSVETVNGPDNIVRTVFISVCNGFQILANDFPEFIKYTVV